MTEHVNHPGPHAPRIDERDGTFFCVTCRFGIVPEPPQAPEKLKVRNSQSPGEAFGTVDPGSCQCVTCRQMESSIGALYAKALSQANIDAIMHGDGDIEAQGAIGCKTCDAVSATAQSAAIHEHSHCLPSCGDCYYESCLHHDRAHKLLNGDTHYGL